mgnify:CR=1 FL=1
MKAIPRRAAHQRIRHFLIHRTMDEVNYRTTDTQNLLTLVKRLDIDFKPDALLDTNICRVDGIIVLDIKGRLDTATPATSA